MNLESARKNPDSYFACAEDELEVVIQVRSIEHDCNIAYHLSPFELENDHVRTIIRSLKYSVKDFIQEKLNAVSEGESSKE